MRVDNSDMGVYFWGTARCTIEGLELTSSPSPRGQMEGHRGVWLEHGGDNMMKK